MNNTTSTPSLSILEKRPQIAVLVQNEPTYGLCTRCGAIEVKLINGVSGYRDFSDIGEHPKYPTGEGCEVCS